MPFKLSNLSAVHTEEQVMYWTHADVRTSIGPVCSVDVVWFSVGFNLLKDISSQFLS